MTPSRRVGLSALILSGLVAFGAASASAQSYDAARRDLDLTSQQASRWPRLLGMGRLTLLDDYNNGLTLWDFAGFPTGIVDADSVSTFELRPGTASMSRVHKQEGTGFERQDLSIGELRTAIEGWRRDPNTHSAFGLVGEFNMLRVDQPFDETTEQRRNFSVPRLMPITAGTMPFTTSGNTRYAVRINYELQEATDEYRLFTETPTGQYIDREGALTSPPDFFIPDDRTGSTLGGGVAVSQRFSDLVTVGVAYDIERWDIEGLNESERHSAQVSEERPYSIGQAVLAGRIGPQFEWAADGRSWRSSSQANWNFTLSAGLGATPLIGVGKLLERDEEGSALRTRARYDFGDFELGGAFTTAYRQIEITPPLPGDLTSFNYFRNSLQSRTGADTLALPDSVSHDVSEERSWEGVGGGSWSLNARTIVAAEFHYYEARLDQQSSGQGPLRSRWDVRGGVEMQLSPVLAGRGGYMYRQDDLDDFTQQNEVLSHTFTLGLGLHPPESSWILETGYYFEWLRSDFGDPTEYHAGRQQLLGQIRWSF